MAELDDLRARLDKRSAALSPAERRLAAHLVEHPDRWGYLSSSELAAELGVHRSTIVRFAQKVGFKGYPELQVAVRGGYLESMSSDPELVVTKLKSAAATSLVSDVFQRDRHNLAESYGNLDLAALDSTVQALAGAGRVLCFGRRFSYPIALHLAMTLRTMRTGVSVAPDPGGSSVDGLFDLETSDHVVVVSLRRHSPEVRRALKFLAERTVPYTILTDTSPGNEFPGDARVLRAHVGSPSLLGSYTALVSITHLLLAMVGHALAGSSKRLAEAEATWSWFRGQ